MTDAEIVTYIRVQANKILDIVNRADEVGGAAMAMTVLQLAVEQVIVTLGVTPDHFIARVREFVARRRGAAS